MRTLIGLFVGIALVAGIYPPGVLAQKIPYGPEPGGPPTDATRIPRGPPRLLLPVKPRVPPGTDAKLDEKLQTVLAEGERQRFATIRRGGLPVYGRQQQSVKALRAAKGRYWPKLEYAIGEVGVLREDVLGQASENFRIRFDFLGNNTTELFQVIDAETMIVRQYLVPKAVSNRSIEFLWVNGFPTQGLSDGSAIELDGLLEITGTKQFRGVAGGTRTVYVLEPFPVDPRLKKKPASGGGREKPR